MEKKKSKKPIIALIMALCVIGVGIATMVLSSKEEAKKDGETVKGNVTYVDNDESIEKKTKDKATEKKTKVNKEEKPNEGN